MDICHLSDTLDKLLQQMEPFQYKLDNIMTYFNNVNSILESQNQRLHSLEAKEQRHIELCMQKNQKAEESESKIENIQKTTQNMETLIEAIFNQLTSLNIKSTADLHDDSQTFRKEVSIEEQATGDLLTVQSEEIKINLESCNETAKIESEDDKKPSLQELTTSEFARAHKCETVKGEIAHLNKSIISLAGQLSTLEKGMGTIVQKISKMSEPTQLDLLLIGKTGVGKSATGNSILRRRVFKTSSSYSSVTLTFDYGVSEFKGREIKVFDGPGVGDTRMGTEKAGNLVLGTMENAIDANPCGYHAFCLVVKFGMRFTREDKDTIDSLKKIFGQDFVKKFCIIVMTCGDLVEMTMEDFGVTFEEWLKEQKGMFQELLNECDNRFVLFDNRTKNERKREEQVAKLLEIVDNLSSHGKRYTNEYFQKAKEARDRIIF